MANFPIENRVKLTYNYQEVIAMAEFCLECWNKMNHRNDSSWRYVLSFFAGAMPNFRIGGISYRTLLRSYSYRKTVALKRRSKILPQEFSSVIPSYHQFMSSLLRERLPGAKKEKL